MQNHQELIIVIGGPGSGKGTHCKRLQDKRHYHHISTGDLVRARIEAAAQSGNASEIEKQIAEMTRQGRLLPDELIIGMLKEEIVRHPEAKGFLLDGCPRTQAQAEMLMREIKSPDSILYLNTTDDIMKSRMLQRAAVEGRADDTPETIQTRIKTYHDKTMPVVEYLKENFSSKFHEVDSSAEPDEVAPLIEAALDEVPMAMVGYFELLKLYWTSGSFSQAVSELEKRYGTSEFKISFSLLPFIPALYVLQRKEDVKEVLSANTRLGHPYHNADVAHGHNLNIVATQAFNPDLQRNPLWEGIHKGLSHSVGNQDLINRLIDKHIPSLFASKRFVLDQQFEKFMLSFWCEYMFGPKVNVDEFLKTRTRLLEAMKYAYYQNNLRNMPVLGELSCRFYGWMKGAEFARVDAELKEFLHQADGGLMSRFKAALEQSSTFPKEKIEQAVLDNTFDLILVFDFIHNAMYETLANIVKNNIDTQDKRRDCYASGLRTAFFFPFRARVAQASFPISHATIEKGSLVYVNLLKSGMYHSFGPRACVGTAISNYIKDRIFYHLRDMQLRVQQVTLPAERAGRLIDADVPVTPERYEVSWEFPRQYLQQVLPHYPFKNVAAFYDVMKTFADPRLMNYMVASFVDTIERLNIDRSKLVIVAPEVRGIPLAAAIAQHFHVPQVYIRKEGKIPGPVVSKSYTNAYSTEVLEISTECDLKDKEAVLVDDGIASGGTTKVCCELIQEQGGHVAAVLAMINHTYKSKINELGLYQDKIHTLFDFAAEPPASPLQEVLPQIKP